MADAPVATRQVALILWGSLCAGVALFGAVAAWLAGSGTLAPGDPVLRGPLLALAWALVLGGAAAARLLPPRVARHAPSPDQRALTRTIVAGALCEGPALVALVGLLVTGGDRAFWAPAAAGLLALVAQMPTPSRWEALAAPRDEQPRPPGA